MTTKEKKLKFKIKQATKKLVGRAKKTKTIAKRLQAMGIKGKVADGEFCVLAQYYKKETHTRSIDVDGVEVIYGSGLEYYEKLPKVLRTLVDEFDAEQHPTLIKK